MQPLFIDDPHGPLFCLYYRPPAGAGKRALVHIPAFAEEMNKSRRMIASQSRALAARGYPVLVFDLFGTGDSSGDFGAATWSIWRQNITTAVAWLFGQGIETVDLWGLRLGVLLALDWLSDNAVSVGNLIAWQPVVNGEAFIMQFLRLKVMAAMMSNRTPTLKTADLKNQLLDGRSIEVAGYLLTPDLINPILQWRLERMFLPNLAKATIFDIAPEPTPTPTGPAGRFADKLRQRNIETALMPVVGDAFWSTQEIGTAPNLIDSTLAAVEDGPGRP